MINCSWQRGKTCRLLLRHGHLAEAVSAASLSRSFSQLACRTPEPCFFRVDALLEADTWLWFSAALNECRAKLLVQLQHLGRTKLQECWSLCGLSWGYSGNYLSAAVWSWGLVQSNVHKCIPLYFILRATKAKLKVSHQWFCSQDESVTQLGQELAQKLGLRVRKAYKRPQVWLLLS